MYWQRICTNNTSSLYRKRNYCVKRSSCSTKFDIKYAIRTEIKATPRYEETPIKRTITVTNVKTVKSSSISGMNGRNRLYDDDLFDDDRYKSPTTRKFQGEKRDEDIRLIPKSSNIGSSKYKPVLTRVEENENKKIHIDQRKESIVNNERKFRENPDKNEDKKINHHLH